jgi:diguanylate cyclase (GGDEF)-like protein/PAS domain S-box-containing protein
MLGISLYFTFNLLGWGAMPEIVIPSLYIFAGIMAYATVYHFTMALNPPHDRMQILFACMCLCAMPFAIFHAQALQATSIIGFVHALKWSLAFGFLMLFTFPWLIALYTGLHLRTLLVGISVLCGVAFMVNLMQPYSLQYGQLNGIRTLQLPWGETVTRGIGYPGPWIYIAIIVILVIFGYALFALGRMYHRDRRHANLWMLLAVGLFLLCSIESIFVRLSIVDFIELGPFGLLELVIVISVMLTTETQQQLHNSERDYRLLFENAPTAVVVIDPKNGHIVQANQIALKMTGYGAKEILTITVADQTHPDDLEASRKRYEQLSSGLVDQVYYEKRYIKKNGDIFHGYSSISSMKDDKGNIINFIGSTVDITELKKAEESVRKNEEQVRLIFETLSEGVSLNEIVFNEKGEMIDYKILKVNESFYKNADINKGVPVIGQMATKLYGMEAAVITAFWNNHRNAVETMHSEMISPITKRIYSISTSPFINNRFVTSFHDITEFRKATAEIERLAYHDPLTGLPNRLLLTDRLRQALVSSARGRAGALLLIDLDNFKSLNDTLGHDIGDMLLQQVSRHLGSCIREGDTVARMGGDEFLVMLLDLSEKPIEAAAQAESIGEKILAAINQPYQLGTHVYRCSASIGVTLFSDNSKATDELMKQADIAMYQAKKAGRNALRFFDLQMQESISARVSLESELHNAIEFQQFHLHYQIQEDSSHRPLGAEALIRWIHPTRGLVSPAQFIPLSEETGLIIPIGLWVLETACAQLKAWQQDALTRGLTLAVNVSAKQFRQADFVAQVQAAVQRHAILPKMLKLELTESLLQENIEETISAMNALNEIGIQFSLDDFGTGYSSLQYLKRLPLDQLKIDQSFVHDIGIDSNNKAVVSAIIAMARSLDLDVIAEGVETEEQRQLLLEYGCTQFQGYLFGRPVAIEQFEAMLK